MEENYLISLVVFFLFGFVVFKKDSKVTRSVASNLPSSKNDISYSATGVEKYLQNQQVDLSQNKLTGVSKYLENKEQQDAENLIVVSGVTKYLAAKQESPVSGVSKYVARQSILAKKIAKENVSGVEKYLNNRS